MSNEYICVEPSTAERWANLGIATIIQAAEPDVPEAVEITPDVPAPVETPDTADPVTTDDAPAVIDSVEEPYVANMMFVQIANSGTIVEHDEGIYTLVLHEVSPQAIYFSDDPSRTTGHMATDEFVNLWNGDELNFATTPHAAITTLNADEGVLIVELLNPSYDAETMTLEYVVQVVLDDVSEGLSHYTDVTDTIIPESLENIAVFIDASVVYNNN